MLLHSWRRFLAIARLILALGYLALQLITFHFTLTDTVAIFTVYFIYSVAVLQWRGLEHDRYSLLALAIDFLIFLLVAFAPVSFGEWTAAVFYTFLLVSVVMLYDGWKTLGVSAASIAAGIYFASLPHKGNLLPILVSGGIVACAFAMEREHLQKRLSHMSRQAVLYRYDAEKAREAERQRIAADFHDGPLQSFISFSMRLELVRKLLLRDKNAATDELMQLQEICKNQVNELRTFVRSMRPMDVEGTLTEALRRVVDQFQKDSGVPATFAGSEFLEPAEPEISLELLQIVREALYNVQKHSKATRVAVSVRKMESSLEITIEDNGSGFPFSGKYSLDELEILRLGPTSIKRRVRTLGAEMLLDSKPGEGAGLLIRLAT